MEKFVLWKLKNGLYFPNHDMLIWTLYTKTLNSKLLKVLHDMTDFYFDGGSHKYISVHKVVANWISKSDSYSVISEKHSFKVAIKYILDNVF